MAPSAALVAAMLAWVSSVSGLPPAPVPRIVMTARAPDGTVIAPTGTPGADWGLSSPGQVYLNPAWDAAKPVDMSVLAHELTHIEQFASGRHFRCDGEMEAMAYDVQSYYLAEHGVDFWRQTRYTPAALIERTECP
jgi:hypothetical protein